MRPRRESATDIAFPTVDLLRCAWNRSWSGPCARLPTCPCWNTLAMSPQQLIALAFDPARMLRAQGLPPDRWQSDLLVSPSRFLLLNCSRQSGKSTTVAALALHRALF